MAIITNINKTLEKRSMYCINFGFFKKEARSFLGEG
jgi:hypothetical protein